MKNIFLPVILFFVWSCSNSKPAETRSYIPGFKTIRDKDTTRIYKPDTDNSDHLHYRPIDIDIWYPAAAPNDSLVLFRDLLELLEERADYYTASDAGKGMASQIARYFCDGLKCSDPDRVLNFKTQSFVNAKPAGNKFPLVIYFSAFNGMGYENFSLFEELVKKGFVVACINSIGRFPGDMTMQNADMMEQVHDAKASINILRQFSNIDFAKIGVVGYSWGGLSGAMLAGTVPGIDCLVSLDGSEFHRYGSAKEENDLFDGIRHSAEFRAMHISAPYLRLESSPSDTEEKIDSIYRLSDKLAVGGKIVRIDSAQHEDFSAVPQLVRTSGGCPSNQHYNRISKLTIEFLEEHLKK